MSTTNQNNCACPPTEIVQVPGVQGQPGTPGAAGSNGVNSYTLTTASITIPTTGSTTTASVANVSWMSIGQTLLISDGTNLAHFQVTALQVSPPVATIKALGNNGDSASTTVINSGASVSPSGVQGTNGFTVVGTNSAATGGSQAVSATPSQALSASLTLVGSAGKTYILFARVRLDMVGATFAAMRNVTLTLRRTNNTAANNGSTSIGTPIVTTVTYGMGEITIMAPYTTNGSGDTLQPFISIDVVPSAGQLNVVEASITATELT